MGFGFETGFETGFGFGCRTAGSVDLVLRGFFAAFLLGCSSFMKRACSDIAARFSASFSPGTMVRTSLSPPRDRVRCRPDRAEPGRGCCTLPPPVVRPLVRARFNWGVASATPKPRLIEPF